ncbi:MAG: VWA domain-containing protein [Terracidiphilus sp.]
MKLLYGFRGRSIFTLEFGALVFALAGSVASLAQTSPAPPSAATVKSPSALIAETSDVSSAQQDASPQSFTVQPGTPEDEQPIVVIHSTTRRVVVDVVVTGPDGTPVPDLTQQDFTVLEDRKPQSVRAFELHNPEQDRSLLPSAPPQLSSHTFMNLEQTPASGPLVVVLLDYLNTPVTDQAYAHQQIVSFLERKPASMEVAIFALADDLTLVQGFTTDTSRLLAAMHSKAAGLRMTAASEDLLKAQSTLDAFWEMGRFLATQSGRKNLLWFSESFNMMVLPNARDAEQGTIIVDDEPGSPNPGPGATMTATNMTTPVVSLDGSEASMSGFSHGMGDMMVLQERMRKVATALAVSQTAVYPIDVRGLVTEPGFSASATGASIVSTNDRGQQGSPGLPTTPGGPPPNVQSHNHFMQSLEASHATMGEIADATGGHAFVNTNGLVAAARQAVSEGSAYYTLVYAPSNLKFDGGLRSIHVTLDKPGCRLAYRSAYYAVDPATVTPEDAQSGALASVMVRGAPDAQGLVFKARIDPNGAPALAAPDSPLANKAVYHAAKKSKRPQHLSGIVQSYNIRLAILAQQLQLTAAPDGRRHAALEIAVYAYAADGQRLGGTTQKLTASMPAVVYQDALRNGMFHNLKVELPVEAASLRLAILDSGNNHAGSLEVRLPLPPTQQSHIEVPAEHLKN